MVEGDGFEIHCAGNRTGGSNPPLSAPSVCGVSGMCDLGEVTEWLKVHDWNSCVRESVPGVRIPLSPPQR